SGSATVVSGPWAGPSGIDFDSKGSAFIGTNATVRRIDDSEISIASGLSCSSDFVVYFPSGSSRLFADWDPTTSLETPNSQFEVLTACFYYADVPISSTDRVYWSFLDVDDPASDPNLDPPIPVNDNTGSADGSPPFTEEPGFPLTVGPPGPDQYATVYGNYFGVTCSRVRFHPTDAPGDNFTVTARLKARPGEQVITSNVMTVWKRVHVELDSMGEV